MVYKVFFAFQMDTDDKFNKGFIQSALEMAIERFKKEGITIKLDFGFRGTPGTPLLIEEMLKKSYESDMVLVDLTFTSSKNWFKAKKYSAFGKEIRFFDAVEEKKSSNPNVLLETGYAWAQKGYYRTLAVMNTAYGNPDELSVDLKGFRWGITFNVDHTNDHRWKAERETLAGDLYKAIKDSIAAEASYQRDKWKPFKIYQDWKSEDFSKAYRSIPELKELILKLRNALKKAGNPQRIVGPKNSGKTRLARELYQAIDGDLLKDDSIEKILYYDIELSNYPAIERQILDLATTNQDKVVVIDNCPVDHHRKLCKDLFDTNVRILTIGESSVDKTVDDATIRIDSELARKFIKSTVNEKFSGDSASSVIQFADGNIRNALLYLDSSLVPDAQIETAYEAKWKQLLGKYYERGALKLLEALSIFKYVGLEGTHQVQREYLQNVLCSGLVDDDFFALLQYFIERGMVKRQGDFIILETFVDELATSWWGKQSGEFLSQFFKQIADVGLSKQFGTRLIELNQKIGSGSIVKIITGNKGIFDYNYLNTDQGASLIMSLSEIAPKEVMTSLDTAFKGRTLKELLEFKEGRRYLVWALERLCFRNETFKQATRLLYRLAQAENEVIGNNATGKFFQLFQPILAGTEANLNDRFDLLMELTKEPVASHSLILTALNRALKTSYFHRDGGADEQAGKKLNDYQPTRRDLLSYWENVIRYLISIEGGEQSKAQQILIDKFKAQYVEGDSAAIFDAAQKIIERTGGLPEDLRQQFTDIITGRFLISPDQKFIIEALLESSKPKDLNSRMRLEVITPPYQNEKRGEHYVDISSEKARQFARELVENKDWDWLQELKNLQQGEQRQTFAFAQEIGKLTVDKEQIIVAALTEFVDVKVEEQNELFISGFLSGVNNEDFTRLTIDKLLGVPKIAYHAIRLSRFLTVRPEDLEKLIPVVKENPTYVVGFQYLKYKHLSDEDIIKFFTWLSQLSKTGNWVSIDLIEELLADDESRFEALKGLVISLVRRERLILEHTIHPLSIYKYELLVNRLINHGMDPRDVIFFTTEIRNVCSHFTFSGGLNVRTILYKLLDKYWQVSWPIIGAAILDPTYQGLHELKEFLKGYKKYESHPFLEWVKTAHSDAPLFAVMFLDFEVSDEDGAANWNPLVKTIIDDYGNDSRVLQELSGRLHSYTVLGSALPIFESRRQLVSQLLNHPNVKVKAFAQREVADFDKRIVRENKWAENQELGEYGI